MGLYVPLDVTWPDDESVIEVGLEAAGLHAVTMCLAKRMEEDGWIGRRLLTRYGGTDALVAALLAHGLLELHDDGRVRPSGWLKHNPSQAAIAAKREAKKLAGKIGNHTRWHSGDFESCPLCFPQVVAGCETGGIAGESLSHPMRSPESEGEGASDRTSSHPGFAGPKPPVLLEIRAERAAADPSTEQTA